MACATLLPKNVLVKEPSGQEPFQVSQVCMTEDPRAKWLAQVLTQVPHLCASTCPWATSTDPEALHRASGPHPQGEDSLQGPAGMALSLPIAQLLRLGNIGPLVPKPQEKDGVLLTE